MGAAFAEKQKKKAELLKVKKQRQSMENLQLECMSFLTHFPMEEPPVPTAAQFRKLLKWQGLEVKNLKSKNEATWNSFFSDYDFNFELLPSVERWSQADEAELEKCNDAGALDMADTVLQRRRDDAKAELKMAAANMNAVESAEVMAILAARIEPAAAAENSSEAAEADVGGPATGSN